MSIKSPGSSVPTDLAGQARTAWYQWKHYHQVSATDPMTAGLAMYARGWRECFLASVEMAGLRPVVERWVELLEELRIEAASESDALVDERKGE